MSAGYSGTPLVKKLGIKAGFRVALMNAPDDYLALLGELPGDVHIDESIVAENYDFVHAFFKSSVDMHDQFLMLKAAIQINGTLWISWPKKSSKVVSDLDGNVVRECGLDNGLVDVKVAAIDTTWSGLKFVHRKVDRG